jgi:hypothetical protein
MNTYYELDISNFEEIRTEIENFITKEIHPNPETSTAIFTNQEGYRNLPKLSKLIQNLKLKNVQFMLIAIQPGCEMTPHIDNGPGTSSVLLPIKNTKGSKTLFYSSSKEPEEKFDYNKNGERISWFGVDLESCVIIDEVELSKPIIINNRTIHNAINPANNGQRWSLALVIIDPEFEFFSLKGKKF